MNPLSPAQALGGRRCYFQSHFTHKEGAITPEPSEQPTGEAPCPRALHPLTPQVLGTVPGSGDKLLSKVSSALEKLRVQWESRQLRDGQPPDLISRDAVGLGPHLYRPQFQYLHRA